MEMNLLHPAASEFLQLAQAEGRVKTIEEVKSAAIALMTYAQITDNQDLTIMGAALDWVAGRDKIPDPEGETLNPCIEDIETATNFFNHFVKDGKFDQEAFEKELTEKEEIPW